MTANQLTPADIARLNLELLMDSAEFVGQTLEAERDTLISIGMALKSDIEHRDAEIQKLKDALKGTRSRHTVVFMLRRAALLIDARVDKENERTGENWTSFFSPHLKRTADSIEELLAELDPPTTENQDGN